MSKPLNKIKLKIYGMRCVSCEVLIEYKFKEIKGVEKVSVSYVNGEAEVFCCEELNLEILNNLVNSEGYSVSFTENQVIEDSGFKNQDLRIDSGIHKNTPRDYFQMSAIFLVIISVYYILNQFDLVPAISISENMSYGVVFLIGLFAAVSTCIAVVGGLLLAVSGKYTELHPKLTGVQKFRPHIYFNIGRIVGYTGFGALVGSIGSALILSPQANGYLIIIVSLAMLILGFQLLHLFPWLHRFSPKMPKFIARKVYELRIKDTKGAPFVLGATTFFLPCGFTQSLQLYVLASGDWKIGALTMLVFSLGTLPALLSLSVISSFTRGAFQKNFMKFAGVLVVMLALFNINNGLTLAGYTFSLPSLTSRDEIIRNSIMIQPIFDGKQVVKMTVMGYNYSPNQFKVVQGIPVEWQIDARAAVGCGQVLVMPTLGISKYLSPERITIITFTPTETGTIPFNCSMGMMTRGSEFTVIPNTAGIVGTKVKALASNFSVCDPSISSCIETQKVFLEVSRGRGFYPQIQTIKNNIPVELIVDTQIDLGGCMGTMTIPEYGVAQLLKIGKNLITFTPIRTGTTNVVCSMGMFQTSFNVIN